MAATYHSAIQLQQMGDLDAAEKIYRDLLDANPHDADVLHLLSILLAQRREFVSARFFMEQAVQLRPAAATYQNSLGNILQNLGEFSGAIACYQQALKLQPANPSVYNNLGNVFYKLNDFTQAKYNYALAIELLPDYVDAYYNLALVLSRQHEVAAAITTLQKVLTLDSQHSQAHQQLALLLQLQNKFDLALRHYQCALRSDHGNVLARHNLAVILVAKNKWRAALRHFLIVLAAWPKHLEALHNIATIYLQQKQLQSALKYFLRLLELVNDYATNYNIAVIYLDLGHIEAAVNYFHAALRYDPDAFPCYVNLGAIYLRREDYQNAGQYYQQALKLRPDDQEVKHILAAINQDQSSNSASEYYAKKLFDHYAPYFEQHLKLLDYAVPQQIYAAVASCNNFPLADLTILDLGCGTGLAGEKFKNHAKKIIGIDLSEQMLKIAREKQLYSELQQISLQTALTCYSALDLIIAADVLVYCGDLAEIFAAAHQALHNQGLFVFTLETTAVYPYVLQRNVRYAHNPQYIAELCENAQFLLRNSAKIILRKQYNALIEGHLYILQPK